MIKSQKVRRIIMVFILVVVFSELKVANASGVQIYIDNKLQYYDTQPILLKGRTLVPLRGVLETLDSKVDWDGKNSVVTVIRGETTISLKIKQTFAYKNNVKINLDVPAQLINQRTYVPLRFISQAIGAKVDWNSVNQRITICLKTCNDQVNTTIQNIDLDSSIEDTIQKLGAPKDIIESNYGFDWYIFHTNYQNYLQLGVEGENIVAIYTNSNLFSLNDTVGIHSTKASVRTLLGDPLTSINKHNTNYIYDSKEEWDLYSINNAYFATIFYDIHNGSKVTAIQLIKKEFELGLQGFYGISSEELRKSYEKEMFYLVNAIRVRNGLPTVKWNDRVAEVARSHSNDMAINNYFDHKNLDGKSPFDRMSEAGLVYRTAGENLAVGQFSAIFAHEGLLNSYGHRKNILNSNFEELGVGVSFQNDRPYFTQNYYTGK